VIDCAELQCVRPGLTMQSFPTRAKDKRMSVWSVKIYFWIAANEGLVSDVSSTAIRLTSDDMLDVHNYTRGVTAFFDRTLYEPKLNPCLR